MRVLVISIDAAWTPAARTDDMRARRVARLADAITDEGNNVTILTSDVRGVSRHAEIVAPSLPPRVERHDVLANALQANNAMLAAGVKLVRAHRPDIIHAHDWSSVWAAAALKEIFGLPVVSTIHGLPREKIARQAAWWLTFASRRTIVHDRRAREEVEQAFGLPHGKQDVIGPGRGSWRTVADKTLATYATALREEDHAMWPALRRDVTALRALWQERIAALP